MSDPWDRLHRDVEMLRVKGMGERLVPTIDISWTPLEGLDPQVPDRMPMVHVGLEASPTRLLSEAYLSPGHRNTILPASLADEAGIDPEEGTLYRDPLLPGVRLVLRDGNLPLRIVGRRKDVALPVRTRVAFHDETILEGVGCLGASLFRACEARIEVGGISLSLREEARPSYGL